MYKIVFYETRRGDYPTKDFIQELDKKARAKIWRHLDLLAKEGPNLLRPYADHVRGKIKELRIKTGAGNIRIFYFFFIERTIILLHAFKKKTQKLPENEIGHAERNMTDCVSRYEQGEFEL
ncbi:MAG: type II toxin-antitoxin system RelE/ParE family toxin [Elusimicrobiota bacterium]